MDIMFRLCGFVCWKMNRSEKKALASSLFTKFILTSRIYKNINIYVLNIIKYFHCQLSLSVITLQIIFEPKPITLKNMTDTKRACPKNGIGCAA